MKGQQRKISGKESGLSEFEGFGLSFYTKTAPPFSCRDTYGGLFERESSSF